MTTPKWTEERTNQLINAVGDERPVSRETVAELATKLDTTSRSIGAKLRKLEFDVETVSEAPKAFSDEVTEQLREFVTNNSGNYTYAEIADNFPGDYTAKSIQGKILSMELNSHVKKTPKKETVKTYTAEQEATIISMAKSGAFLEDIAAAVGNELASVRGKALSLYRNGDIASIPKQKEVKAVAADPLTNLDVSGLTVTEIADKIGKTERGVKTMLSRRGLSSSDYDGAGKKAKKAEA